MVQQVKVNSSNELYDNKNDESRVYDIEADVHVEGTKMRNTDRGTVYNGETQVAQFNSWDNHLNVTYMNVGVDEQNIINTTVNTFINEVKESVANR